MSTIRERIRNKVAVQRGNVPRTYLSYIPHWRLIQLNNEQIAMYNVPVQHRITV